MVRRLRVTLLPIAALAVIPAAAAAQDPPVDSLIRRIEHLERTTRDLESRVRELDALVRNASSPGQPMARSVKWQDLQNWRRLRRGMTMDEVRAVLGEPDKVEAIGGLRTTWRWGSFGMSDAYFDGRSNRLDGWSEPDSERLTGQPPRR